MNRKKEIFIFISGLLVILFVIIGVSYAYFTANITGGEESTTINVKGGKMLITYDGGDIITLKNILPDNNPAATKTFTVTGFNNTEVAMAYKISLVIQENTFSSEALKYKLISENTDSNGNIMASIAELTDIPSEASTIELGIGSFEVPTVGNKTHTYNLEIHFPNQDYDQNENQGKQIKAYVLTENYINPCAKEDCLGDKILAKGGGAAEIEAKGAPNFSASNGTNGLYASLDEYGTSYYYRGTKALNNNIIWGGFQWKVVRINGDGSIRLIYNGTEDQYTTNGEVNNDVADTQIGTTTFTLSALEDNKYVGYMFGGIEGVASLSREGITSTAATFNETSSNIKDVLDNWYKTNILNKPFESQVIDNLFCNDRQLQSEVDGGTTGSGFGQSKTLYAALYRLTNNIPTLKCVQPNNRFTVSSDIGPGNGVLTYPIGLITVDEASMGGFVYAVNNGTNYLYTNQSYWTISPYHFEYAASLFCVIKAYSGDRIYFGHGQSGLGVRPLISISSDIIVTGTGSSSDPFVVENI